MSGVLHGMFLGAKGNVSDSNNEFLLKALNESGSTMFTDKSKNGLTITTEGNTTTSTSVRKFTTSGSVYFDGDGDRLTVSDNAALQLGTGNWTIEFWCNWSSVSGNRLMFYRGDGLTAPTQTIYTLDSTLYYQVNGITGSTTISTNTWYHIAVSRSGSNTKMFVDGNQSGSTLTDTANYNASTTMSIGDRRSNHPLGQYPFQGYIQDLRISRVARYTTTFTPPTAEFTP